MSDVVIHCPECDHQIELLRLVAKGKQLRCLACGARFTAPAEAIDYTLREHREDADPYGEEREWSGKRRSTARPPRGNGKTIAGIAIGCGLLTLLVCGGIIAGIYWSTTKTTPFPEQQEDYAQARKSFRTRLTRQGPAPQPFDRALPPPGVDELTYASGNLRLKAWVTPAPPGGGKQPAVLFLHGGFAFGGDDWDMTQPFRAAGYVVMTPMLRGENGQPGNFTMFYDEVDDVLAAADALAQLPYVDSGRIYLSGHSAGGTLTMLAALTSNRFRAAGAFSGSPDQVAFSDHNPEYVVFNRADSKECEMRSPLAHARSFKCPVRIYYGSQELAFRASSQKTAEMARAAGLDVEAISVPGDHFTSVPPAMRQCIAFFQQK